MGIKMVGVKTILCLALISVAMGKITMSPVERTDAVDDALKFSLCPTCVSFAGQAFNQLINIILNAGVIGGCGDLCGHLDNKLESTVCSLLCDYVGIQAFIDIIDHTDFDPIYDCELLKVCPVKNGGAGIVKSVNVSPPKAQRGSVFDIDMVFEIFNATGTGEIVIEVDPPMNSMDMPIQQGFINTGYAPGTQGV